MLSFWASDFSVALIIIVVVVVVSTMMIHEYSMESRVAINGTAAPPLFVVACLPTLLLLSLSLFVGVLRGPDIHSMNVSFIVLVEY